MKLALFMIFAALALIPSADGARANGTESSGGGGNLFAIYFKQLASMGISTLSAQSKVSLYGRDIDIAQLGDTLAKVQIEVTDKALYLNEKRVSAINYPSQTRVLLNGSDWDALPDDTKLQLTLHELWGITFDDHADDNYKFSTEMVRVIRTSALDLPLRIVSLVSTLQNGRGQTFRALVIRQGRSTIENKSFVVEKLQQVEELDVITSRASYFGADLPYGKSTDIRDLRIESFAPYFHDSFRFEAFDSRGTGSPLTCSHPIPEPPAHDEIKKIDLKCAPTVPRSKHGPRL